MTIVGIGTLPVEAVTDETAVAGTVVLSRAFYEEHRDLAVYAVSNVDLAPGADARVELASAIGALGHQLQSARTQEQQSVDQALRPLIIVLVALGCAPVRRHRPGRGAGHPARPRGLATR